MSDLFSFSESKDLLPLAERSRPKDLSGLMGQGHLFNTKSPILSLLNNGQLLNLILWGPPGTGKTAFARWLADRIGIPLYTKRASDLISMWLGETEQNIARAFKQATDDGALLLIDEVDSFLQDRRNAQRSWEVSQVNELLIQMETFNGIFIASTNLMDSLDQAALRRFDLKVKFGFLKKDQAETLFLKHCEAAGFQEPGPVLRNRLRSMDRLTPGDFAAVLRQNRFKALHGPEAMLAALEAEASLKEGAKGTIGFIR